ncbi:G-protein coupled receptor Mth2 [Holothuria leucospilota]|uniref:G-protein coupled receptor Mth2 n=1 Tax=Holothuria leucospilota TaxID=206669 RepID=A0A9Q1BTP8_HOLLE|nr:G-protein coupled receptor Mth2 [Holothuria leucospilota]
MSNAVIIEFTIVQLLTSVFFICKTNVKRIAHCFFIDVCNHIITNNGSVITSPNHPEKYGNFEKCEYHVHCDEGQVIEVTFLTLDLEEDDNCLKDSLTVNIHISFQFYDGDSYSSMVLARLCGFNFPTHVIKTSGEDLYIVFTTNNVITRTGFSVQVNFVTGWYDLIFGYLCLFPRCNRVMICFYFFTAPCNFCSVTHRYYGNCPSNAPPIPFVQQLQLKSLPPQEFLRCRLLTGQYATPENSGGYYWMIGDCPKGTNAILKGQCIGEDQDIYNAPLYHPLLKVLFKNKYCALCNGHSLDDLNKQIVYSTCDTCKYTYEFKDRDILETPSSDCKVHPKFLLLEKCDPFRKNEDIKCPTLRLRREVAKIFSPVAAIIPSSLTCPDGQIVFGGKCVKISPFCSSTFQENLLVLDIDITEYSKCNYLAQRSTLCFFHQLENFERVILQNKTYKDMQSTMSSHSLSSFFLPWKNVHQLEWLENSRGSKVLFEIPVNVTLNLKWKDSILAALQSILIGNGSQRNVTRSCFLKSVRLIDICKLNLEQDMTKCKGVIEEAGYYGNDDNVTYSSFKKMSGKTLWHGVLTTLQVSEESVIRRKLVFCNKDGNLNESKPKTNLFNDFSCGIAVICLLVTFFIYAKFSSLRNTFGIVVMVFVKSLALGIIILQFVNPYITNIPWFCSLMGIVAHWLWISIFCWMTVLAYDLHHTFSASNMRIVKRIHRNALIIYFGVGWGLPFIVVAVCIILWIFTDVPIRYGSHSGEDCWIYDSPVTLVAVCGPLLLCIFTNLILYILIIKGILEHRSTTREARRSVRATRNSSQAGSLFPELIVCIKISLLMGFTWLSGFIAPLTNIDAFKYLFYFLMLLQAILIFIFFGANTRARKLWMKKLGIFRVQSFVGTFRTSLGLHSTNVST